MTTRQPFNQSNIAYSSCKFSFIECPMFMNSVSKIGTSSLSFCRSCGKCSNRYSRNAALMTVDTCIFVCFHLLSAQLHLPGGQVVDNLPNLYMNVLFDMQLDWLIVLSQIASVRRRFTVQVYVRFDGSNKRQLYLPPNIWQLNRICKIHLEC